MGFYLSGSFYSGSSEAPEVPRVFTRFEKGQALSHAEMDTNLTSLFHTASFTSSANYPEEERIKEAVYCTLHYASQSLIDGEKPSVCREPISFQCMPSADDVRQKLANEEVPGDLGIKNDLSISGSSFVSGNLHVLGTLYVNKVIYEKQFKTSEWEPEGVDPEKHHYDESGGNLDYTEYSDARLKSNIVPITGALEIVENLNPVTFTWKNDESSKTNYGLIAQEVQEIFPDAVSEENGYLKVDYFKLIPLIVQAIKELKNKK